MTQPPHAPTRTELQVLFARAFARRAERRAFIETLRRLLERRNTFDPLLRIAPDRRRVPREA